MACVFANLKISFHAIMHLLTLILFLPLTFVALKATQTCVSFKDPFRISLYLGCSKISIGILRDVYRDCSKAFFTFKIQCVFTAHT